MAYPVERAKSRKSGEFGPRKPIKLSNGQWSPSFHGGVDFTPIVKSTGLPVYAVGAGTVYGVNLGGGAAGRNVMLRLGDGSLWWYSHLSRIDVDRGQRVTDGQQIGVMGATGNTTGVHLHLERHWPRIDVETDPWPFIAGEPDPTGKGDDKATAPLTPTPTPTTPPEEDEMNDADRKWLQGALNDTEARIRADMKANVAEQVKLALDASTRAADALTKPIDGFAPIDVIRTHAVATLKAVREQASKQGVTLDETRLAEGVLDQLGKRIANG